MTWREVGRQSNEDDCQAQVRLEVLGGLPQQVCMLVETTLKGQDAYGQMDRAAATA